MTKVLVLEGLVDPQFISIEDGGQAKITEVVSDADAKVIADIASGRQKEGDEINPFFVRLHSWSTKQEHKTFDSLIGKRVRITVEIVEENDDEIP